MISTFKMILFLTINFCKPLFFLSFSYGYLGIGVGIGVGIGKDIGIGKY